MPAAFAPQNNHLPMARKKPPTLPGRKPPSTDEIVLAAYNKFARGTHAREAVNACFGNTDGTLPYQKGGA